MCVQTCVAPKAMTFDPYWSDKGSAMKYDWCLLLQESTPMPLAINIVGIHL